MSAAREPAARVVGRGPGVGPSLRWGALAALLFAACARQQGPEATLRRFLELVDRGKDAEAFRLTSPAYREQCDRVCFGRVMERSREELRRALLELRAGGGRRELQARLELGAAPPSEGGGALLLVQRADQPYRLAADPLDFYPQGSPAEALRSFILAIERSRWSVAMGFVPQRLRQQVTAERLRERWTGAGRAELRAQLELVKRHLAEPLIIEGPEARLPLGERREARLVLEEGRWHVLQLQ